MKLTAIINVFATLHLFECFRFQRPILKAGRYQSMRFNKLQATEKLSLEIVEIPMSSFSSPAGYRDYIEEKYDKAGKRIVRWHIYKVDTALKIAYAEIVVYNADDIKEKERIDKYNVSTSRRDVLSSLSLGPLLLLLNAKDKNSIYESLDDDYFDLGGLVRGRVKAYNDGLIDGTRRINEEVYKMNKRLQGKSAQVNPPRAIPPLMDLDFINKIYEIPNKVYCNQTNISASTLQRDILSSEQKFYPYFERGAGGSESFSNDIRNQTYYSFLTYAQWKVFMKEINTPEKATRFTSGVAAECLRTVLSDVSLKRYNARREGLNEALLGCTRLLDKFKKVGYITGYSLQTELLDATSFVDGAPCAFTLVLDREAPLGSKILLDYEGSKNFLPNIVAGCLAEYLRECSVTAKFESYYLDDTYHSNPDDYQPVQTLVEWTIEEE